MNVKQIIEAYLKQNGFDGLYEENGECACEISDLMPWEMSCDRCLPGYKKPCDCGDEDHNFHITAKKPVTT